MPFKGTSIPSIMKKHLTAAPPTFAELGVQVPSQVEAVVRHGLEKEALNRPASVAAFINELRDAVASASLSLERTQVGGMNPSTVISPPATTTTPPRPTQNTSGDLAGTISSGSLEDYAQMQSSASMEAQRLRDQAALLDERARQASEAQKREQDRREQERLEEERREQERREQERREMEDRDRLAREELAREEAFRLQAQAEARRTAEEESARQRAGEEARIRAEQEARRKAEEETKQRAEQEARQRVEQEARQRAEMEARQLAEREARLRAEQEERRKAEEESARLLAEAEARERAGAEAARMRAAAEDAGRKAAEENARRRAEEQARLQAEDEARQRQELAERERQQREREERERAERQLTATSLQSYEPSPSGVDLEATQHQRYGTVTQPVGANSLPGAGQQSSWQQQSQPGLYANSASGSLSGDQQKKSSLPMILAAAIVGFVVLVGGGVGIYFMTRTSTGPSTPPPIGTSPGSKDPQPAKIKAELIAIPSGTFQMGRDNGPAIEAPAHTVTVGPFAMDKTEVTNAEYADFVSDTNYSPPSYWANGQPLSGQEQWPVTSVSVADVTAFADWRSKRDGVTYRLPTEDEWEFAARGGNQNYLYPWGNSWSADRAVVDDASPKPVGSYTEGKNRWGVLDLVGNVWEWTSSKASYYPGNTTAVLAEHKDSIVYRGGSYATKTSETQATGTLRNWQKPSTKHPSLGFRLVRSGS